MMKISLALTEVESLPLSKTRRSGSANRGHPLNIGIVPLINVDPGGERMHSGHPGVRILAHDPLSKWHMMVMEMVVVVVVLSRRGSMLMLYYFGLIRRVIVIIMGGVDHVLIIRIIHGFSTSPPRLFYRSRALSQVILL